MKVKNDSKAVSIIDDLGICYFDGTYSNKQKKGSVDIPFSDYIDSVRNPDDKYIKQVDLIRKVKRSKDLNAARKLVLSKKILGNLKTKDNVYKALKWKAIHVYPSCQFDKLGCKYDNVTSVSGLLVYDLQGIDQDTVKSIRDWPNTVALHKSIGGDDGDYALFLYCPGLSVDSFSSTWDKGDELIQSTFGIKPDSSDETKDVTRIRYLSYDPDCSYNPFAEPVLVNDIVVQTKFTEDQQRKIDDLLNSEPQWHKFGLALAVSRGEAGRELYHTFSSQNKKKYDSSETDKKYDRLISEASKKRAGGLTAATLFYMLKEMGVNYATPKIAGLNIRNGKKEEITVAQTLEFLNQSWVRNEINDKMLNYNTGRETNPETIWTEFQLVFNEPKMAIGTIHSLLRSERMNTINPVKNFFEEARNQYDNGSYIDTYINTLPLVDKQAAALFIKTWLIHAYRQAVFNMTNRTFLIYKGATENIGKSSALNWLCPVDGYLKTGPLNTDSKDTRIALAHNFMWNDDELKVFRSFDVNKIKALISTDVINERSPYAKSAETLRRICSFCGSTNADELLPASEGNTRFLVVELAPNRTVRWADYVPLDKKQFWGEVIKLEEEGWLEKHKDALNVLRDKVNTANIITTPIRELVLDSLRSTLGIKKNRVIMRLVDIIRHIDPENQIDAMKNHTLVRDIITKEFGSGRTMGILWGTDERRAGFPCEPKE